MAYDRVEIFSISTPSSAFPAEPTFHHVILPWSADVRGSRGAEHATEEDESECNSYDKNDEWGPEEHGDEWIAQTSWLPNNVPESTIEVGPEVASTTRLLESTLAATGIEIQTFIIAEKAPEYTKIATLSIIIGKHSTTGASVMIPTTTSTKTDTSNLSSARTTTNTKGDLTVETATVTISCKPSVTIGIPDFVPEFSTQWSDEWMMGKYSPTGLPTPLPLTYINPSAGVSVVPTHGPTVSFVPNGDVSMLESSSVTETETVATATSTTIVAKSAIDQTPSHTHKVKAQLSTKTRDITKLPKTYPHTKTDTIYTKTKIHSTHAKAKTHPTHTKANSDPAHAKKPIQSLEPRNQNYKRPGCSLSALHTTTTTSLSPSTLLHLPRRSPGHYIDQVNLRALDVRPVETSLGTKDSADNVSYDESTAATPWKPWGAQSGSGLVYENGSRVPSLIPVVVGIVFGVLVVILGSWIAIRVMLYRRAKNQAVAARKEMDTEQVVRQGNSKKNMW